MRTTLKRYPGPDQGEYAGLPVTDAAVSVAESYSPELLTEEHTQCRPHPSIYGFRGVGMLRVWEDRDPYTQQQTQIETWIAWQSQHRHIWMNGREHPPWWAPHSWEGFRLVNGSGMCCTFTPISSRRPGPGATGCRLTTGLDG